MGSRDWVKFWVHLLESLKGNELEYKWGFVTLVLLAGASHWSNNGTIRLPNGLGYTDELIAKSIEISEEAWLKVKKKLVKDDRIKVHPENVIEISNWSDYQSEYASVAEKRAKRRAGEWPEQRKTEQERPPWIP